LSHKLWIVEGKVDGLGDGSCDAASSVALKVASGDHTDEYRADTNLDGVLGEKDVSLGDNTDGFDVLAGQTDGRVDARKIGGSNQTVAWWKRLLNDRP